MLDEQLNIRLLTKVVAIHESMSIGCSSDDKPMFKIQNLYAVYALLIG